MRLLALSPLVLVLAGCSSCALLAPDGGSDSGADAGLSDSSVDAGTPDSGCLLKCAPSGWTDGGFSPRGVMLPLGLPTYCSFEARISASGAVLSKFGLVDGGCPKSIALADGGLVGLNENAEDLLSDDSWVECPGTSLGECHRMQLDGGRIATLRIQHVNDATLSGWVTGDDIGTATNTGLVLGPDGGRWAYPVGLGGLSSFNEQGVGVGQYRASHRVMIWRDGVMTTVPLRPPATSDWGTDINESGMIGGARHINGFNRAALYWDNEVLDLPMRRGNSSEVLAVNDNNLAVGVEWDSNSSAPGFGFVWGRGRYVLLDELLPDAGCTVVRAMDINNANQIAARVQCIGTERPSMVRIDLME